MDLDVVIRCQTDSEFGIVACIEDTDLVPAVAVEPTLLRIDAVLEIGTFRIEPDQYDKFREFCRKVDETTSQRIHLEKTGP